jgi:hypothetical protein
MTTRTELENLGITKKDLVDLLTLSLPELTLTDLEFLIINVEYELQYRADNNILDEGL